jgi:hypothetical protein
MVKMYKEKIHKIKDMLNRSEKYAYNKINENKANAKEILELQKSKLKQLDMFIFNLTEIKPKS